MSSLREQILSCLATYGDEDSQLVDELESIIGENGFYACSVIFEVITHLNLDTAEAKYLWYQVMEHRRGMRDCLGRNLGLRASLCDYLCAVNKTLKNPILVEIQLFESYIQSYMYDYLTGLYSRGFLDTILQRELARCKRYETELSMIFFDIDNFKEVNDKYGHAAGDECLSRVASIMQESVRIEDTVVRYGGEEIVVIFPLTNKAEAKNIGERIRKQVARTGFGSKGHEFNLTISGGLVSYPVDGCEIAELMEKVDQAMYLAKEAGKNNILFYSREKRRYTRVNLDSGVEAKPVGFHDKSVVYSARGKNISSGGMLLESDYFFGIGTKLQLKLPLRHSGAQVEVTGVTGEVVRAQANRKGRFDTGICFQHVERPAKNAIDAYLVG